MPFTVIAADSGLLADSLWSASAALAQRIRNRRTFSGVKIDIAEGADAIALAAPAWRALEKQGGAQTAFQTLAVAQPLAAAHLRAGQTPRIVVASEGGRPAVVFPTVVARWNGMPVVRFLGDPLIQYGDVIASRDVSAPTLEAAWHAAADPSVGKVILLRKVRANARIASVLARNATTVARQEAPFIDPLRPSATRSRDARELRRFRRRLADRAS